VALPSDLLKSRDPEHTLKISERVSSFSSVEIESEQKNLTDNHFGDTIDAGEGQDLGQGRDL
jgi:hypothetical protein